jgi:hypothetical protein
VNLIVAFIMLEVAAAAADITALVLLQALVAWAVEALETLLALVLALMA